MSICPPLPHPSPLTTVQHSKPLTGGYAKGFSQWASERSVAQSHLNPSYCLSGNSPGVPGAMGRSLTPQREQLRLVWPPSPPLFCLVASSHGEISRSVHPPVQQESPKIGGLASCSLLQAPRLHRSSIHASIYALLARLGSRGPLW